MKLSRRNFLKALGYTTLAGIAAPTGGFGYATRIEPYWLSVERITIPLPALKPAMAGVKIVQVSDIHLHPYTQIELVQRAVEIVNKIKPDLIFLTGDYVLETAESIFELAPVLAGMNARFGIFAILGNHDLWTNAEVVRRGLDEAGIPLLVNQGLSLGIGKDEIFIAGLDDGWSGKPDLQAALSGWKQETPVILMMHEPDFVDSLARDERISLQLSGHTHGGQVRVPGVGAIALPDYGRNYDIGLHQVNQTMMYVNRGLGVIGPPVRFNCQPEISEITLVSSPAN